MLPVHHLHITHPSEDLTTTLEQLLPPPNPCFPCGGTSFDMVRTACSGPVIKVLRCLALTTAQEDGHIGEVNLTVLHEAQSALKVQVPEVDKQIKRFDEDPFAEVGATMRIVMRLEKAVKVALQCAEKLLSAASSGTVETTLKFSLLKDLCNATCTCALARPYDWDGAIDPLLEFVGNIALDGKASVSPITVPGHLFALCSAQTTEDQQR